MRKLILIWTKTTYVATFILFVLCLTFSYQQQVIGGLTEEEVQNLTKIELEVYNEGNLTLVNEFLDPNYIEHTADKPEAVVGIEAFKERVTYLRTIYPDLNLSIVETIVKDDRIVWRWVSTGTFTGTNDLPPTGKKMRIEGVGIIRVVNGKIAERLIYYNEATVLRQLGYTITPPTIEGEE